MAENDIEWIEVARFADVPNGARYREEGLNRQHGIEEQRFWYQLPPLPTIPYAVIVVAWRSAIRSDDLDHRTFIRWSDGRWESASDLFGDGEELTEKIRSFRVLFAGVAAAE